MESVRSFIRWVLPILLAANNVACIQSPGPQLLMPKVVSVEESANYASVKLTATLDHAGNVKQAGFYLWRDAGEKRRQVGGLAGSTLTVRWDGLEPETEYQYAVFFSNGQTEQMSNAYRFSTSELPMPGLAGVEVTPSYFDATFRVRLTGEQFLAGQCMLSWWKAGGEVRQQAPLEADGTGSLVCTVSDLLPETDYRYSITLSNGKRTQESAPASFRTLEAPYTVALSMKAVPKSSEALLSAVFTTPDGAVPAPCGFLYREASAEEWLRVTCIPAAGRIEAEVRGLFPETDYLFCVWYTVKGEEVRSEPEAFRTLVAPEQIPHDVFDPVLWDYLVRNYDTDADGELSDLELADIRELVLSGLVLDSHRGLEYLTNLESLSMGDNTLSRIDVSANKKLQFLSAGSDPYLEEIVLDNPALFQTYFVGAENLHHLDLTHCPEMYICEWYGIPLESVDFTKCPQLHALRMTGTHLKELDVSANRKLRHLNVPDNPELKTVWLWEKVKLESLEVDAGVEIKYK